MNGAKESMLAGGASDIAERHWSLRLAPAAWAPYLRLARVDRPFGTWLLLLPGLWSLALAAESLAEPRLWGYALLFAVGAFLMRSAGCVINDLADRRIDAQVARTRERPLASGALKPRQALGFLALLLLPALVILLQFNWFAVALGAASLLLVVPYPFMKRITYWPQLWLGLTFNWGALLGWAAVRGDLGWPAVLLYLGGIAWTLGYDTIYAHSDKEDDLLVGVKSTALRLGAATRPWLFGFYAATLIAWAAAAWTADLAWPIWPGLLLVAAHFAWQAATFDGEDPASCLTRIKSNRDAGLILLAAILVARLA